MDRKWYYWCAVSLCTNTSKTASQKVFVPVPFQPEIRQKWLQLAKREDAAQLSSKSVLYFCEDHFDLPNDMENYMQYKIMGSVKNIRMKPGCMPSRFECQSDRRKSLPNTITGSKKKSHTITGSLVLKPQRAELTKEVESSLQILKKSNVPEQHTYIDVFEGNKQTNQRSLLTTSDTSDKMELGIFSPRKKSKSRVCCAVNGCRSKTTKDLNLIFHSVPKPGARLVVIENYSGSIEKLDQFEAWKNRLKLTKITPHLRICSLHFKKSDYILPDQMAKRRFLKKTAVPSCNLPIDKLHDGMLIEYINIKTELEDTELINKYEQIKSDPLDTEFMNKKENTIIEELRHSEIIIKEENIKIEQELHTEVIIKEEIEESDLH